MSPAERREKCTEALENCAAFSLRKSARLVGQHFDEALQSLDLKTTQVTLLMLVDTHPASPMHVIAEAAGLSPSTLSRNLQPLVKNGLIEVTGSNRAGKHATLTRKGARLVEKAFPIWTKVQNEFSDAFGDAAWTRLRNALSKANTAVSNLD